jgi:hypothetical protein
MAWQNKHMGFLKADGFAVPVDLNPSILGNMLVMDEANLAERLAEREALKQADLGAIQHAESQGD